MERLQNIATSTSREQSGSHRGVTDIHLHAGSRFRSVFSSDSFFFAMATYILSSFTIFCTVFHTLPQCMNNVHCSLAGMLPVVLRHRKKKYMYYSTLLHRI